MGPVRSSRPDIVEGVRRIKSQDGQDLILSGSSTLTSTLLEHGLADEVLLVVYPVLVGTGKRLFAEGTPPRSFELVSAQTTPAGILLNHYKVARPLKAGGTAEYPTPCSAEPSAQIPKSWFLPRG